MAWRARQRSENRRAGGLKGRDRGWLPGSTQANAIGIPHNLVNKTRERTNTLVTREAAANIAGGQLTEPLPDDFGDGEILIDTRSLVVNTNQLGGIGRFRSQFNVDADGIKHARYYLPIYPKDYFKKSIGDCNTICEKARPNSVISIDSNSLHGITTQNPQNIWTLRGPASHGFGGAVDNLNAPLAYYGPFILTPSGRKGVSVYLYSIGVNQFLSQRNYNWNVVGALLEDYPNNLNESLFMAYWDPGAEEWPYFNTYSDAIQMGAFPKDQDEQQAYSNVYSASSPSLATWQGYLTGISNPITQLWIITNVTPMETTAEATNGWAVIFTKSTDNPLTDYNKIPDSNTDGATLTSLSEAPLAYYGPLTLTPSGGSRQVVYLYSIGVNQWLSQRNYNKCPLEQPVQDYPNNLTESFFNAYWNEEYWPYFNLDNGAVQVGALPKDQDEQQAYINVFTPPTTLTQPPTVPSLATWQGYLTGISNPITELWIIANARDSSVDKAVIFTKSTNNPVTDYNKIPDSITDGTSLTTIELRTLDIFFTHMFGLEWMVTEPQQITNNNNNTIGFTYVMQEVTADNWSGFYVTPLWNDPENNFYPVSFNNPGGKIEFDYEIQSENDMEIRFKFERYGHSNCADGGEACTVPYFFTEWVQLTVNSSKYHITIDIPIQNGNQFSNIIFYLNNAGTINITNVRLTCDPLT